MRTSIWVGMGAKFVAKQLGYKHFLQKECRHTLQWCRHNNTDSKAKCVNIRQVCRHNSRVCRHELQFFWNQSTQVDTLIRAGRHWIQLPEQLFCDLGQEVDTLSERVDTGYFSSSSSCQLLDNMALGCNVDILII
ncbi:hypothetical protein Taro_055906 [Colocasia esculenta]|uniref:Uncharacterized protein n=1 Tax=Colocasia esculenta TaxID=4460 RepID=A0A843XS54_COLES|nr:hypothetical protein [Colocasia esculenta]